MVVSIHTNAGFNTALRNVDAVSGRVERLGARLSSGYKIAGARDDGSIYAVAQGLRADIKSFQGVEQTLAGAKGLLEVSVAALTQLTELGTEIRKKIIEVANPANTPGQTEILKRDLLSILHRHTAIVTEASYNSRNQFLLGSTDVDFVSSIDADMVTVPRFGLAATFNQLVTATDAANTPSEFLALMPHFNAYDTDVKQNLGVAGSIYKRVLGMQQQNQALADAVTAGLGSIVDADMAKESAVFQAQETQRGIATRTLTAASSFVRVVRGLLP